MHPSDVPNCESSTLAGRDVGDKAALASHVRDSLLVGGGGTQYRWCAGIRTTASRDASISRFPRLELCSRRA